MSRNFQTICSLLFLIELCGAVTIPGRQETSPVRTFNVTNFGAKGDGKHDDAQAIQTAIDAAGISGGDIFVPSGKYLLKSRLIITDSTKGLHLRGAGFSTQLFFENPSGIETGIGVSRSRDVTISTL